MEKILETAANQVPSLVVLVVVVIVFLRAQKTQATDFGVALGQQRDAFVSVLKTQADASADITEQCHAVARDASTTVRENTKILGRVEHSLEAMGKTMEDTNRALRAPRA
jgi:hypothetical protein